MNAGEIDITREGTKLQLSFLLPHMKSSAILCWECGSEWAATLLCDWLRDNMASNLINIRRDAYNHGWKSAKSKKGKKDDWFASSWSWRYSK